LLGVSVQDGDATETKTVFSVDGPSLPVPGSLVQIRRYDVVWEGKTTKEPLVSTLYSPELYWRTQRFASVVFHESVEFCTAPTVVGDAWNVTDGVAKVAAETDSVTFCLAAGPSLPSPGSFVHQTKYVVVWDGVTVFVPLTEMFSSVEPYCRPQRLAFVELHFKSALWPVVTDDGETLTETVGVNKSLTLIVEPTTVVTPLRTM